VSADDLRVEPHVLDDGAMNVGALASPYVSPICMNLRNAVSIQCTVSEETVMGSRSAIRESVWIATVISVSIT